MLNISIYVIISNIIASCESRLSLLHLHKTVDRDFTETEFI